jgi:hypothetical protein
MLKPLRNEQLHRLTEKFVASVPEQGLSLSIHKQNSAVLVRDEHRVRRGLEKGVLLHRLDVNPRTLRMEGLEALRAVASGSAPTHA